MRMSMKISPKYHRHTHQFERKSFVHPPSPLCKTAAACRKSFALHNVRKLPFETVSELDWMMRRAASST